MRPRLTVAVGQMNSTDDVAENLATIASMVEEAAGQGADLVTLPENAPLLAPDRARLAAVEPLDGRQVTELRTLARRHSVAIALGSFAETGPDDTHSYNTSVFIDEQGEIAGVYRKMHLFDVQVADDTAFRESDSVCAGPATPVQVAWRGWSIGLSICYDLRFPELYRAHAAAGTDLLLVPAAFTFRTGAAHWDVLLRARAIENLSWVVASAQVGRHYGRRESWGHALAVSPWGEVVASCGGGDEGMVLATLEPSAVDEARARIPALHHRRIGR